jgi:putative ABC transport system permease protein
VRIADILGMAISALWQQKVRTVLTMLGVVVSTFVLAASLSIGQGVQETFDREAHRGDLLRRIEIYPQGIGLIGFHGGDPDPAAQDVQVPGEMSDNKRLRLREAISAYKARYSENPKQESLTKEKLQALAALDHVETVVPSIWQSAFATFADQSEQVVVAGVRPDYQFARQRLVAGRFLESPNEPAAVVSEFLLYRWGLIDDAAVGTVLGKKLRLEFRSAPPATGFYLQLSKPGGPLTRDETAAVDKIKQQLPAALDMLDLTVLDKDVLRQALRGEPVKGPQVHVEEFTIVGVVRLGTKVEWKERWSSLDNDGEVLLPFQTATDLYFHVPGNSDLGVHHAVVLVDRQENVKEVSQQAIKLGVQARGALEFIEQQRLMYLLIFGAMTCVAGVALLVASLGIANTMLMSVLERTREIGIMKAVGAGNGQLQLIFLVEGAFIGLCGGSLGLLLSWLASFPAESWVNSMVARDLGVDLKGSLFVFPLWLTVAVIMFAVLMTTVAAGYPARRAARVDPVTALRHE